MAAGLVLSAAGFLLAIWWWKSSKQRMEEKLRLYFKELAEWEMQNQKSQFGTEKQRKDGSITT